MSAMPAGSELASLMSTAASRRSCALNGPGTMSTFLLSPAVGMPACALLAMLASSCRYRGTICRDSMDEGGTFDSGGSVSKVSASTCALASKLFSWLYSHIQTLETTLAAMSGELHALRIETQ